MLNDATQAERARVERNVKTLRKREAPREDIVAYAIAETAMARSVRLTLAASILCFGMPFLMASLFGQPSGHLQANLITAIEYLPLVAGTLGLVLTCVIAWEQYRAGPILDFLRKEHPYLDWPEDPE